MQTVIPANSTARPDVSSVDHRRLRAEAAQQALPVAGDDEQRVVDADAEPDQQRQLRAERRHVDHVREQADDRDAGAEREARGEQRQHHRQQRAEDDEQDDRRGEEAERGAARALLVGLLDRLPAELDLQPVPVGRLRPVDDALDRRDRRRFACSSNVTVA